MEIITEEPLKIISQLLIPLFIVIVTGLIQICFKIYLSLHEKNKYIKHLKANFPSVEGFLDALKEYKINVIYFLSYVYFVAGVVTGFLIELILVQLIVTIFSYAFDTNYIGKLLGLSSETIFFNIIALLYSFFNIGVFIILFVFILWCRYLVSNKLLIPKLDNYGKVEVSSYFVYPSFWFIIGIVFGLYLNIFFYLIGTLSELSIIDNNLSFNRTRFDLMYAYLLYPVVHVIVYMLGFLGSIALIVASCYITKRFSEKVIKSITNFYKYDFPYIKIKTESGEIKGQLRGILDKYLVTLSENNILKIAQWDKIETMEISQKNKKEDYIINDVLK